MDFEKSLLSPGTVRLTCGLSNRAFFQSCSDHDFAKSLGETLLGCGFGGFFWEVKPISEENWEQDFECVVVDGPVLKSLKPTPDTFADQFRKAGPEESVIVFPNLGGDAMLISPLPNSENYPHFAEFLRNAPDSQQAEFWRKTGETAISLVSEKVFWLSTAGLGVSWLHLRFDSRPKYYRHQPYKIA